MKAKFTVKQLTITAMLLAMCIVFQMMKSWSVYLTGSAVNCILVVATVTCGFYSGSAIALLTPVIAFFIGATPIVNALPLMMPVIMIGNELLVLAIHLLWKEKMQWCRILGMAVGCVAKAGFLWVTVWYVVLPMLGTGLPPQMVTAAKASFSVTQLITACIGCAFAWLLLNGYIIRFVKE